MVRGHGRILTRGLVCLLGLLEFLPRTLEFGYPLFRLLVESHLCQDLVRDSDYVDSSDPGLSDSCVLSSPLRPHPDPSPVDGGIRRQSTIPYLFYDVDVV